MNVSYKWQSFGMTHVGRVRKTNEDNFIEISNQGLWVVADGMGGMSFGEKASQYVVDAFVGFKRQETLAENVDDLESRIIKANDKCRSDPAVKSGKVMGSTVVLLFFWKDKAITLWVGDSRLYRIRKGQLEQLSTDHSLVQEMVEFGQISKGEAELHPRSNVITRGVGLNDDIYVDMEYLFVQTGDRFLLCSDGLNKHLMDYQLISPMQDPSIKNTIKRLMTMSIEGGGSDNITVILVDVKKPI
jgi:serine/threonine protein phosphatase PrpC